ncbi:MAG: hypothetical protein ACKO8G_02995 [Actinomycetota bacterium]
MNIGEIVREVEALPVDPVSVPGTAPAAPEREPVGEPTKVPASR